MSAPYRIEGSGDESWVVDANGKDVVVMLAMGDDYHEAFTDGEIMQIICDGLNARERKEEA